MDNNLRSKLMSMLLEPLDAPPPIPTGVLLEILHRTEETIDRLERQIRDGHHCRTLTENYTLPEINTWSGPTPDVEVLPTAGIQECLESSEGASYPCITEGCRRNQLCVYLKAGKVPRWPKNAVLTWYLCDDGLTAEPEKLDKIEAAMIDAAQDWNHCDIGVQFKQVFDEDEALFRVMYDKFLENAYAEAFAPGARTRIVYVSRLALDDEDIVKYLRGILTHELGHVLGLRHHFWSQIRPERDGPEAALSLLGQEFEWNSVMNPYFVQGEFWRFRISDEDAYYAWYFYNLAVDVEGYPIRVVPAHVR